MPRFCAAVEIHYKPGVFDPAGQAVARSLAQLGHATVGEVRVGKHLVLTLEAADAAAAAREVDAMCRELLANPVIETYRVRVEVEPA